MNNVRRCFAMLCVLLFPAIGMPVFGEANGDAGGTETVDQTAEGAADSTTVVEAPVVEPVPAATQDAQRVAVTEPVQEIPPAIETPVQAANTNPVTARPAVAAIRVEGKAVGETGSAVSTPQDSVDMASTPIVVTVLQKKESQLVEAKNEIARLKDIVKKIAAANRREQAAMHYNLGCAYKAAGDSQKAESELLKSLALDPQDAATHYNLGILYDDDLKNREKAKEHYQKYLMLAPNSKDSVTVLEWLKSL